MANVTGSQGQESTREDLPGVRHEHESLAVIDTGLPLNDLGANRACAGLSFSFSFSALSENLTDWPPLCNFLHPLNREEPTLSTAIRLERDGE